jgi:hypothetical protein
MEFKMTIPYTAKMEAFDYKGFKMPAVSKEIKGISEEIANSNVIVKNCCLEGCCAGDETDQDQRPHCWEGNKSKGKDVLCSEVDKCFEDKKAKKRRWIK